jgi:hypothetical protein
MMRAHVISAGQGVGEGGGGRGGERLGEAKYTEGPKLPRGEVPCGRAINADCAELPR